MHSLSALLLPIACLLLFDVSEVDGLSCLPCSFRKGLCKPVPKGCQAVKGLCGCCDVCARKLGQRCGWLTPACERHLVCRSKSHRVLSKGGFSAVQLFGGKTCQIPRKG